MQVTLHEAKTHLSRLIAAVERGEEVVIARRDKPVVRLVIERPAKPKRSLGFMLKPGQEPPNFDAFFGKKLEDEIERDFYDAVESDSRFRARVTRNSSCRTTGIASCRSSWVNRESSGSRSSPVTAG